MSTNQDKLLEFIENISDQTDHFDKLCDCKCFTEGYIGDHEDDCMTAKIRKDYNELFDGENNGEKREN